MTTLAEQLGQADTQIHDALALGVETLGQSQQVSFVPYVRTVLPLDGYVFWLRASLLTPAQQAAHGLSSADPIAVDNCSLHYASIGHMVEDETIAVRRVDLTSPTQITAFAEIAPDVLWVASWTTPLGTFRFTFGQRSTFYQQASIWHYVGDAVYPVFETQLIDDVSAFDQRQVVSNSLPLWLAMVLGVPFPSPITTSLTLYPSYLVPDNLTPPYGVVHVYPETTTAYTAAPVWDATWGRSQLCRERVRLTLYGLRNDDVMNFVDYALQYSILTSAFGVLNMPVVRDDHRTQVELTALAMRKTVDFEVSYLQSSARDLARQVIKTVVASWVVSEDPPIIPVPPPIVSQAVTPI